MINLKPTIVSTLKNDAILTSLLGGQRIYFQVAPTPAEFPRITYFELSNLPALYGDSQEQGSEITFVLDVWSKVSVTAIANRIDELLTGISFVREFAGDLYEQDTGVYHKPMRYRILR